MHHHSHYCSDQSPGTADEVVGVVDDEESDEGGGFTFLVPPLAAEGACIVPMYPIFGQPPSPPLASLEELETATVRVPLGRLLLEEWDFRARQRDGSRAQPQQPDEEGGGDGELEGVSLESYCLWALGQSALASPRRCRKSGSTGSVLRWHHINERLVGRGHSDGKEKFVFLRAISSEPPKQEDKEEGASTRENSNEDAVENEDSRNSF